MAGWTVSAGQVSWVAYEVTSNQEEFTPSCWLPQIKCLEANRDPTASPRGLKEDAQYDVVKITIRDVGGQQDLVELLISPPASE